MDSTFSSQYRRVILACALLTLAAAAGACSFLLPLDECTSDADCREARGSGWACSSNNLCERGALLGEPGEPCRDSAGPIEDPDAFNIGVLLPLTGDQRTNNEARLTAIELAQREFNELDGIGGRPIGLIICDTAGDDQRALDGADHLVNSAGVQAIIGPNSSTQVIQVANTHAVDAGVTLVSPSATATTISNLDDDGLVWRTAPSDTLQGEAIGRLATQRADEIEEPTIALLARRDDIYARGLRDSLVQHLPSNIIGETGTRFIPVDYDVEPPGSSGAYSEPVNEVLEPGTEPDIVIILGFTETWSIIERMELETQRSDIIYILPDAARAPAEADDAPADLDGRVLGSTPRNDGDDSYEPWRSFAVKFQADFGNPPSNYTFVANSYDALYAVALAAAGTDFQGGSIADGMTQLSDGSAVDATQSGAQQGLTLRQQGESIDLRGASGPLDFGANGDPTSAEISLWCLQGDSLPEVGVLLGTDGSVTDVSCQ
jgi:branched-chain amino acid transport system substrate-binding protein